tara:strand:+ start:301 stop:2592 length:2292 start_codon:yes stop_codon:yes gene_type:complete
MNSKKYIYFSLLIFSCYSFGQSIDPEILSELSQEQLDQVKTVFSEDLLAEESVEGIANLDESLVDKDLDQTNTFKKFGYDFFSKMPTSIAAIGDLPLSDDYKIALRDQLRVILSGSKDATFDLNVRLDGTVLFPQIGSIFVAGLTFGEVKEKLSKQILDSYIGVNIDVALKDLSAKKITIVGAVETPGTYLVNPFSTITSALAYSGGVSDIGSLRDIKLIRDSGEIYSFDLYDLLIKGSRGNDLNVQAGDTILITAAKQFVEINGAVNRPGIYELKEKETVQDAIDFSLGFTQTANKSNISVSILDIDSASVIKKTINDLRHGLENALDITVFNYSSAEKSNIQVFGAVKQPGFYSLDTFTTLSELVDGLEFINVYPWMGVLEQFDDENLIKSSTLFSLKDKQTIEGINLLPNSKVFFVDTKAVISKDLNMQVFDGVNENSIFLIDQFSLTIDHFQGTFSIPVFGEFSVLELVNLLGLNMDDVLEDVTYISPFENTIINSNYKMLRLKAQKYNTIKFRSPVNDLIQVQVSGAVDFPGFYTLQPNSSLQDLYDLVGNFKEESYGEGIILTRESVRATQIDSIKRSKSIYEQFVLGSMQNNELNNNLDLLNLSSEVDNIDERFLGRVSGDFVPGTRGAFETILFDGDEIIVPKYPSTINVFGEVLNPISFQYENNIDVRDSISMAGGFQTFADQSRIYVIRANGSVVKSGRNVFSRNIELLPGDTVVVPRKFPYSSPIIKAIIPITQILSDVAFSAAAIESLSNN